MFKISDVKMQNFTINITKERIIKIDFDRSAPITRKDEHKYSQIILIDSVMMNDCSMCCLDSKNIAIIVVSYTVKIA